MNKIIEKLIEKADYEAAGGKWKEYFAELIVRECIDIVGEYSEDGAYCQRQMIKERFGVK